MLYRNEAHIVYVGVGSNLGDSRQICQQAIALLGSHTMEVQACSSFYRSTPVGYSPQPHFLNAVVKLHTNLPPLKLLARLKAVEKQLGKDIKIRWGPRTIDLDILMYDNLIIDKESLQVPHPRMHTRSFVMLPLVELAPQLIHPVWEMSMRELLEQLENPTECIKVES